MIDPIIIVSSRDNFNATTHEGKFCSSALFGLYQDRIRHLSQTWVNCVNGSFSAFGEA
jgi:hypothetical protein